MQDILVEGQHEDNQDKQSVEHGEEKDRFVSQFFQTSSNESLKRVKYK
jgi:hypothetical protein